MYIGILFGIYVFITIGIYHVLVVKVEEKFGVWPWVIFLFLGLISIYCSWTANTHSWSLWWGYNAFLNLWTIVEMFEQPERRLNKERLKSISI